MILLLKKVSFAFILVAMIAASFGCAALLEGDVLSVTPHETSPQDRPPQEQIEVSSYDELKAAILDFIMEYESRGQLIIFNYDGGDVAEDVDRACYEILNEHPVGAFAVSEIAGVVTRIVSYFEVDISIEYKRTNQQLDSIVNVSTLRYLRTELLSIMSDYRDEAVFRTSLQITEEEIIGFVEETYYQNPRNIVMMPVTAVEVFPESGRDRIFELRFSYIDSASILRQYGENLALYVRRNAELAVGDTDSDILLSLAKNIIASTSFDEGTARTISVHGAQNFAATAFGALVNGSAVGEGFAMAFKALCDELGFDCLVVLGYLDGGVHAWNIVSLYGYFYHVDLAMGVVNGIETAFLKTDEDFEERYTWDRDSTVICNGTLTYEDIVNRETTDDPDTDPSSGSGSGSGSGQGNVGGGAGSANDGMSESNNHIYDETEEPEEPDNVADDQTDNDEAE